MDWNKDISKVQKDNGELMLSFPGGYYVVYWFQNYSNTFPLCAHCARETLDGKVGDGNDEFFAWESGECYEHDLPCEDCGVQLAGHYEED